MSQSTTSRASAPDGPPSRTGQADSGSSAPAAGSRDRRWLALPVVLAGTFMTILDFFIVNVAIPSVQSDLHASSAQIQFVVAGYGLAYAAGLITGGRLGDIFGRRRLFAIGLVLFVVMSAFCGLAPTAGLLVLARVLQGVSAALMFPQVLSILNVTFTGADRAKAFMYFGVTLGLAAVCGQVIGGVLISADLFGLDWRSCFLINVPIGALALAFTWSVVPQSQSDTARKLDLGGVVLGTAGLVLLLFPLVEGRQAGWPLWSWICLAASVVLLAGFIRYEWALAARAGSPLVEPVLFQERSFNVGLATILVFYGGLASLFLVLAVYLQEGQGFSPLKAGLTVAALAVGFFISSVNATRLAGLLHNQALALGALIMAASYAYLIPIVDHGGTHVSVWALVPGVFFNGLGEGAVMGPVIALVLLGVKAENAGSASGVLTTVQQIAGALGVAIIGIIFYGALGGHPSTGDYPHALQLSLTYTLVLVLVVAGLVQLLPGPKPAAEPEPASTPSTPAGASE